ncbi:MAG: hypothetical protein QGH60_18550 [Phycisphaerae bacterium]|jgi:hypothetical protein|nr:hypothetical protein [Phycisphaerae bacterium]
MGQPETHPIPDELETLSETPPPPKIPWERRKHIGRFRAYWRTAKMVMFSPCDLEQFLDAPVCEKHAKKFRRVTVQLTFLITLGVLGALMVKTCMLIDSPGFEMRQLKSAASMVLARMGMAVLSLIGLFLATRSLEWFSSPKYFDPERQDKAIALSCYACGPILIVTIVGAVASLLTIMAVSATDTTPATNVITLAWWSIFLAWWPASVQAIHFTTGQNARRTTIAAIALPLIWIGQQLLMGIIPISVFHWRLIIASLS